MTNPIGSTQDPALQPAAAAARTTDAGTEATRKALDQQELEGREAVQLVKDAPPPPPPAAVEAGSKGRFVNKTA